jgi:DNA-3-methyladenine glycosylase I
MSYCDFITKLSADAMIVHKIYHDNHYGFPIDDDNELFCRLVLEINQAGLSWTTILKKQEAFRAAYHQFDIKKVAAYTENDVKRLLADAGIIRNKLKINAAIENARAIALLQKEFGSFKNWLDHHHPISREEWMKLFKKTFKFTGGEIVNEFLVSTGYLPGSHDENCPIYKKIIRAKTIGQLIIDSASVTPKVPTIYLND